MRGRRATALIALVVLVSTLGIPLQAAEPGSGTVAKGKDVSWQGGPFVVPRHPAGCLGPNDPLCDTFLLDVDAAEGAHVLVGVEGDIGGMEWYDLAVYRPDGTLAAANGGASSKSTVVFEHSLAHGDGLYLVQVEPAWLVDGAGTYQGYATLTRWGAFGGERDCYQYVPGDLGLSGITDQGQTVDLGVLVLHDGVSRARARQVLEGAAASYAPLDITLRPRFRKVMFSGDDAEGLMQQAKALTGGARPAGVDVVLVLTSKDILLGDEDIAGLADCIGGIRYPQRAFAVSEDVPHLEDQELGPLTTHVEVSAKIAAHEIGHLLGAHHHLANCVEGDGVDLGSLAAEPCTLMDSTAPLLSFRFSTLNGAVVRGHAVAHGGL